MGLEGAEVGRPGGGDVVGGYEGEGGEIFVSRKG